MRVALEIVAVGWAFSGEMFPVGGELARILRGWLIKFMVLMLISWLV